jgi:hypothetical protein
MASGGARRFGHDVGRAGARGFLLLLPRARGVVSCTRAGLGGGWCVRRPRLAAAWTRDGFGEWQPERAAWSLIILLPTLMALARFLHGHGL